MCTKRVTFQLETNRLLRLGDQLLGTETPVTRGKLILIQAKTFGLKYF